MVGINKYQVVWCLIFLPSNKPHTLQNNRNLAELTAETPVFEGLKFNGILY